MQHPSPQLNRDHERDSREREMLERHRQEEMAREHREHREREREQVERQQLERQQREQQHHPVQSHQASIPIHQPVASKVQNSIHGPNGILSTLGGSAPPGAPQNPMQSSGPAALYAQIQHSEGTPRPYMQHPQGPPGQPMLGYNGSTAPSLAVGVAAAAQGQQPILNVSHWFPLSILFAPSCSLKEKLFHLELLSLLARREGHVPSDFCQRAEGDVFFISPLAVIPYPFFTLGSSLLSESDVASSKEIWNPVIWFLSVFVSYATPC